MEEFNEVFRVYTTGGNREKETKMYIFAKSLEESHKVFRDYCKEDLMFGEFYLSSCDISRIPRLFSRFPDGMRGIHFGEELDTKLDWVWRHS